MPKYVERATAKGHVYYYFRVAGRRIGGRFKSEPGTPEFHADYAKRLAALTHPMREPLTPGSLKALIADYRRSPDFKNLSTKTQRDYERMLRILSPIEDERAADVRRSIIVQLRNDVAEAKGNRSADYFVAVVGALFRCGMDLSYGIEINPAHEIRRVNESESYLKWPLAARRAFEAADMPGWLRTGYMLGLWTTLRLNDVLTLARTVYDGDGFDIRHSKNDSEGYLPAAPELRAYLAQLPVHGLLFVCDDNGKRIKDRRFSKAFRAMLDDLGFPNLHFHGLRHTTATALAEAGASAKEIAAITGHKSTQMVERYTKQASQKRLAKKAMRRLEE